MRLFNFVFCLTVIVVLYFTSLDMKKSDGENLTNQHSGITQNITNMLDEELSDLESLGEYEEEIYNVLSKFMGNLEYLEYLDIEIEE